MKKKTKKRRRVTKADGFATVALAMDLIDDIEGSGHNSRVGTARQWLRDAYRAGQRGD